MSPAFSLHCFRRGCLEKTSPASPKEIQVSAPFQDQAAVNFSTADWQAASDTDQRLLATEIKQERDEEEAGLLDQKISWFWGDVLVSPAGEGWTSVDIEGKRSL
ncbi:Hypothetical predicted protein [Podarcis lilfordi]|uniref:Uncharacterized protein n=1 Tax=Podarcis lilfordi TaxID=74358 RepID=A0AA35K148_9SAUR|nr:Hypothetical predicted protein [Podarcis lilfordi]